MLGPSLDIVEEFCFVGDVMEDSGVQQWWQGTEVHGYGESLAIIDYTKRRGFVLKLKRQSRYIIYQEFSDVWQQALTGT